MLVMTMKRHTKCGKTQSNQPAVSVGGGGWVEEALLGLEMFKLEEDFDEIKKGNDS